MDHHAEDISKHVRLYMIVFGALALLTVLTVSASYLDVSVPATIAIALCIASIKGSLVACYFMHLVSERKLIYWVLFLTVVFFVVLMCLPLGSFQDQRMG